MISRVIFAGRSFKMLMRPVVKMSLRELLVWIRKYKQDVTIKEMMKMRIFFAIRRDIKYDRFFFLNHFISRSLPQSLYRHIFSVDY